ncbi:DEAD/DEAH box helicase [Sphingomonas sp. ASV193]|uniref:DEAD/DEAH box helicase n=1 Tax=Sphingomonas sp. ASV193 TaxID=3144405 RepID=UPI0032E92DDF
MTQFTDLGLSRPLLAALASKNYTTPTPIQAQAIPPILAGRDLMGLAQTGTGKTAAFMLPSLDRLVAASNSRPLPGKARMLVLAPTRELAAQIAESARTYAKGQHLSVGVIFGGVPVPRSIREVSRGLDVLVATPGRLLDLVDQRVLDLSRLEILVLDEADQMLDLGFIHALKRIVKLIPAKRQTLFFSATMPKSIKQLADAYLTNPAEVRVAPVSSTAERVEQSVTFVNQAEKQALLTLFFQSNEIERALVFSRTKHGADKIVRMLGAAGIASNAIHGNKSQAQREKALAAFRSGEVPVLVATDIAARGIDIPGVSHVLNFDLPNVPEQYVHRIGRTARAGASGLAHAFCAPDERPYLKDIEKLTRQQIATVALPEGFMAAVEAIKRLKPAPRRGEDETQQRHRQPSRNRGPRYAPIDMKADRRADGQRRASTNERRDDSRGPKPNPARPNPARHPQRADGHPGHRPEGGRPGNRSPRGRRRGGGGGGGNRASA